MHNRRNYKFPFVCLFLLLLLGLQASSNVLALDIDYGGRIPTPIRTRKPPPTPTSTPTITPTPTPTQTIPVLQETTPVPPRKPPGGRGNAEIFGFLAGIFGGLLLFIPVISIWYLRRRRMT